MLCLLPDRNKNHREFINRSSITDTQCLYAVNSLWKNNMKYSIIKIVMSKIAIKVFFFNETDDIVGFVD